MYNNSVRLLLLCVRYGIAFNTRYRSFVRLNVVNDWCISAIYVCAWRCYFFLFLSFFLCCSFFFLSISRFCSFHFGQCMPALFTVFVRFFSLILWFACETIYFLLHKQTIVIRPLNQADRGFASIVFIHIY